MNTWKRISRVSFSLLFFVAFVNGVYGQRVSGYQAVELATPGFTEISTTGTSLDADIVFDAVGPTIYQAHWPLMLPFDFPYDGSVLPQGTLINITLNGSISLSSAFPTDADSAADALYQGEPAYPGFVSFFNSSMIPIGNVYVVYQVDGISPNQVLTIEYLQLAGIFDPTFGGGVGTNMEVKFYETTGNIEFLYKDHNFSFGSTVPQGFLVGGGLGTPNASIGLNGFSTPSFISNTYATGLTETPAMDIRWIRSPSVLSLEPKSLNFGNVAAGQRDTLCVTANSVGAATLKILSASLFGNPDFSVISGPSAGDTIPVGESRQYCIQFVAPSTLGGRSAGFTLRTDGLDSGTQSVTLTGAAILPAVHYGTTSLFHAKLGDTVTKYISVTSTGTGPLSFNSITITGLNADNYYISHYPQSPLPSGQLDSIGVTFTPMLEGRPDASIIINTNALNIPRDSIQMFGVGILPHLVVTPSHGNRITLSFDSVSIGDSVCETIALMNPGTDTLRLTGQFESGDPDFTFYPLMGSDTMILPNQTKLVDVCFKPLQRGSRLASLRFYTNIPLTYDNPRRDTSQFGINIVGTGVPSGQLVFSGPLPDSAEVGKHICVVDTVMNVGSAPITITNVTITGPNASEFNINGIPPLPFSFPVGLKAMNQICFSPLARGLRTANLLITVEAAGREITETIPLLGHGLEVCASANPTPATFGTSGKTLVGAMDTTVITITNCGDVATAYTATASPSTYTIIGSATSGSVTPNGTASYTVVFAPTAVGAVAGTLSFTGGLPASVPLNGIGAGVTATAAGSAGSVGKGSCQNFDVTITNTGNVDWNAGTPTIAGANASDYTIVSGPTPNPIPAGGTATVTIKFCPSIVGSETATLTFPSGSPSPIGGFSYALTGTGVVNGVSEQSSDRGFELGQSYPNPTNGSAVVMFTLPTDAPVRIDLIDAKGSIVRTVFTGRMTSGDHSVTLEAKDLASGTYFYTLTSGDIHLTRQMILVR